MNRVTIVIANYNYSEYVLQAIDSALNQTYPCRVVIVDDGSTDDSLQKIVAHCKNLISISDTELDTKYYKGPMCVRSGPNIDIISIKNSGASTARNVGIHFTWSETDVFAILDADDEYYPNKVEILLKKLEEYDEIGVVYSDYMIERTGDSNYQKYEFKKSYSAAGLLKECIVHSGALIKKKYLDSVRLETQEFYDKKLHGPLSRGFIGCTEDYDLWLRLSKHCLMIHVPQCLSKVRETGKNQSMRMTQEIFHKNAIIMNRD